MEYVVEHNGNPSGHHIYKHNPGDTQTYRILGPIKLDKGKTAFDGDVFDFSVTARVDPSVKRTCTHFANTQ